MQISRRDFLKSTAFAATLSATALMGCADDTVKVSASSTPTATAVPTATPEPTPEPTPAPTPEPPYYANVLTGEERDPSKPTYRITGVMINNIAGSSYQNARPQRGLSSASILAEIKVEGGITRFCAMFSDLADIPELGPMRSGRDQFLQLVMPYEGLYYHEGESTMCSKYVATWDYWMYNFGGKGLFGEPVQYNVTHRDYSRNVATEHTMFTSGEEIQKAVDKVNEKAAQSDSDQFEPLVMEHEYENTFFKFADYRKGEYNELTEGEPVSYIGMHHSNSYRTYFEYDADKKAYMMNQYSAAIGGVHTTIDELTGGQLGFENVLVLFTLIEAYPGDSGDVQFVDYSYGGEGYYFTNGKGRYVYWLKGGARTPICIVDPANLEEDYCLNRGKTYIAMVSNSEFDNFTYGDTRAY